MISLLNYLILWSHKKYLAAGRCTTDDDVKQAVTSLQRTLDTDFLHAGIKCLIPRYDSCLTISSDQAGSNVYRLAHICHIYTYRYHRIRESTTLTF